MYDTKTRNVFITVAAMAFIFASWVLSGIFGWQGIEWVVGTILGVAGFSSVRALGDYRRTDTTPPPPSTEAQVTQPEKDPDERLADSP